MIVVDASAMTEYLLGNRLGREVAAILDDLGTDEVHIPHLCLTETTSGLRGLVLGNEVSPARGHQAIQELIRFGAVRHAPDPHLPRVWELRHNLTAYDALYVALAEVLDAELVTCDARLARASGHRARVVLVA